QARSGTNGRRERSVEVCAALHGPGSRTLCRRSRSESIWTPRRAARVGGGRQSAGNADRGTPRPGRSHHSIPSVVPVSAGCEIQRKRKHRRRNELCLQPGILAAMLVVLLLAMAPLRFHVDASEFSNVAYHVSCLAETIPCTRPVFGTFWRDVLRWTPAD